MPGGGPDTPRGGRSLVDRGHTSPLPQAGSFCAPPPPPRPSGPCCWAASSAQGSRPVQREGTPTPRLFSVGSKSSPQRPPPSGSWGLFPDRSLPGRVSPFLPSQVRVKRQLPSPSTCALRPSPCLSLPECNRGSGKAPMGSEGTGLAVVVFVLTFITCQTWFFSNKKARPLRSPALPVLWPRVCMCLPGPRDRDASQNRLTVEPP